MAIIAKYVFDRNIDTLPTFNSSFTYTYSDVENSDKTITRTIESNSVPTRISFANCSGLLELEKLDISGITSMNNMFRLCSNMKSINTDDWDTGHITDIADMFFYCESLVYVDFSHWDVSNVTTVAGLFNGCSGLRDINISGWNTQKCTAIQFMFYNCKSLNVINLANLNVSNVTSVNSLFYNCHELSRVILSGWSLDSIELTENMFCNCSDLFTIIMDDTNSATVNYIISELPDGNINTSDPIIVIVPTVPLDEVNETTKNVIITNTFVLAEYKFTSGIDTVPNFNGFDFHYMTYDTDNGDGTITRSIESYVLPPHIDFVGCEGLLEVLQLELSGTTSLFNLFYNCPNLRYVNTFNWDTGHITDMAGMFDTCPSLTEIDLSYMNVKKVTRFWAMFNNCTNLVSLDFSNWETDSLVNIREMFANCDKLVNLDLTDLNISKVTNFNSLFEGCDNLTELNISGLKFNTQADLNELLNQVPKLVTIHMLNSDEYSVNGIIEELPINEVNSPGTVYINKITDNIKVADANEKNWNIVGLLNDNKVVKYRCASNGGLPTFNSGFSYTYYDLHIGDGTVVRTIESEQLPTSISFSNNSTITEFYYANVSNVLSLGSLFFNCYNLKYADVSSFDTHIINNVTNCFAECSRLTNIYGLNTWDTNNITNISYLFYYNENVKSIDISGWNLNKVSNTSYTFNNATNLTMVTMNDSDSASVNKIISLLPTRSSGSPGILVVNNDLSTINVSTANSKYWNVVSSKYIVAKYKYDRSVYDNLLPYFNQTWTSHYVLDKYDIDNINIVTREISYISLPTLIKFGALDTATVETARELSLMEVYEIDSSMVTTMANMFKYCKNLKYIHKGFVMPSTCARTLGMFYDCNVLTNIDTSLWNTSNVDDMNHMFYNCNKIKALDVSNFITNKVTDMSYMFYGCNMVNSEGLDVSNFDTSLVTNMSHMFYECNNVPSLDVSNFDTKNVTSIEGIFYGCKKVPVLDVSKWNVSNVNVISRAFGGCEKITELDLSNWELNQTINDTFDLFAYCYKLVDLKFFKYLDMSKVTNAQGMFYLCSSLEKLDLISWEFAESVNTAYFFGGCKSLNDLSLKNCSVKTINKFIELLPTRTVESPGSIQLSSSDIYPQINATDAQNKYWYMRLENLIVIYSFDNTMQESQPTFNDTYTEYIYTDVVDGTNTTRTIWGNDLPTAIHFTDQSSLVSVEYLDIRQLTSFDSMFDGCFSLLNVNTEGWDTTNITDMSYMFGTCSKLAYVDVLNWNTSNVTDMSGMFSECTLLEEIDVDNWDTSNVKDMNSMFYSCTSLTYATSSLWKTGNVTDMSFMFSNCNKLKYIDMMNIDVSNVTNMAYMFNGCNQLTDVDLSRWNLSSLEKINCMFYYCANLENINLSNKAFDTIEEIDDIFEGCTKLSSIKLIANSNESINKIISVLPLEDANRKNIIYLTSYIKLADINVADANSKNWKILQGSNIKNIYKGNAKLFKGTTPYGDVKNVFIGNLKVNYY